MLTIGLLFSEEQLKSFDEGMRCHFGPLTCLCKLYERLRRIYPPILVPELTNETWTRLFWSLFWDACWRQQPNGCKGSFEALCRSEHGGFALYHAYICVPSALYSTLLTLWPELFTFSLGPVPFHDFSRPLGRNSKRTSLVGHGRTTSFEVIKHVKNGWFQAHL